ncbi:MAG TPA: hypothetical protein V6D26_29560 [Stenomitos sp.]
MSNIEKGIASLLTNGECDLDTLNWASLRYQHTAAVQASLLEKRSPATVKKMMCALKRVLREARKLELMDAQSYAAAVELPPIKSSKKLRGRALSQNEIIALMEVCTLDPTPQGTRDGVRSKTVGGVVKNFFLLPASPLLLVPASVSTNYL